MFSSIVEGEVILVQTPTSFQGSMILYTVEVYLPTGELTQIPNCQLATDYGGLGDYRRRRIRSRFNSEFPENNPLDNVLPENLKASPGERVLLAFVNNSTQYPVIIGFLSHENETEEFVEPSEEIEDGGLPQEVVQYLGVRKSTDSNGNYRVIHKGVPQVSFFPKQGGELGEVSDATGNLAASSAAGGEGNPALSQLIPTELAAYELLEGGIFRAKDYTGGIFQLSSGQVLMSNKNPNTFNDIEKEVGIVQANGVLIGGPPQNEYIQLVSGAGQTNIGGSSEVNITSGGQRVDITFGNEEQNVYGQLGISVFGSVTRNIGGAMTSLIAGDYTQTVGGNTTITTTGTLALATTGETVMAGAAGVTIAAVADLTQSSGGKTQIFGGSSASVKSLAGAGMNASGASIAIGSGGVELFAQTSQLCDKLIQLITALETHKHLGNLGYPTGVTEAPEVSQYALIKTFVQAIQSNIDSVTGSL